LWLGQGHKKLTSSSSADQQEPPPPPSSILDLDRIIGKNVKTVDYQDVGKVVMTTLENEEDVIIISSEGAHATYNYRIPKSRIQGFDGPDLMLSIARTELSDYEINDIKDYAAQLSSIRTEKKGEEKEIVVPVIEEKLNVSKKIITDEAIIIKEPVIETKTIEVSLMHEEIVIEKREAAQQGDTTVLESLPPRNTRTVIRVPLIHEEVKIKKEPYVKEEIVIRKKPRTETKTVSEFLISEKVHTGNDRP
jgi:uncharacterized protein (TIGR02271 family)